MSLYNLQSNKDDILLRNIIIGILSMLNDEIKWYNVIDKEDKKLINVPFYFSTTGDERFLQDNFLKDVSKAETVYNKIPRGHVNLTGVSIKPNDITNKYVRMSYLKESEDGLLNTYNSETFIIPLELDFDIEIWVDSMRDQLVCTEKIIDVFFKNKYFNIDVLYTRVPCVAKFPDSYENERDVEFGFDTEKNLKVTFSLNVDTFLFSRNLDSEMFEGNRMDNLYGHIYKPINYELKEENKLYTNVKYKNKKNETLGKFNEDKKQ